MSMSNNLRYYGRLMLSSGAFVSGGQQKISEVQNWTFLKPMVDAIKHEYHLSNFADIKKKIHRIIIMVILFS